MAAPEIWIAAVMLAALIIYALTGGADFGGGVWDLFASGPRAAAQRKVIANALAPIWEANHVWLILALVLLFVAFPKAFALISITLHIPLTVMLLGIVMRGAAFVFRSQSAIRSADNWTRVFSAASTITPVFLGIIMGSIAQGALPTDHATGTFQSVFVEPWLSFFPLGIGLFTLALFAFLAAVYLIFETDDPRLREDFRNHALVAGLWVGLLAWICLWLSHRDDAHVWSGLADRPWSLAFHIVTGITAVAALTALFRRWYQAARLLAVLQTALILMGWALSQFPYVVPPHFTFQNAAAPASVLRPLLVVLGLGVVALLPSFAFLFYIFKRNQLKV